jgi:hypothetical protein
MLMVDYDEKERELLRALRDYLFAEYGVKYFFISTKHKYAPLDGIVFTKGKDKMYALEAVYETKCRHIDIESLKGFDIPNHLMVTTKKIMAGVAVSKELRVPFYCLTYFLKENPPKGMFIQVTNDKGDILVDLKFKDELSPKSKETPDIKIMRSNAYIDISTGVIFPKEKQND